MPHKYAEIAFTPAVKDAQTRYGSREGNSRSERFGGPNEKAAKRIAEDIGFTQISTSHENQPDDEVRQPGRHDCGGCLPVCTK